MSQSKGRQKAQSHGGQSRSGGHFRQNISNDILMRMIAYINNLEIGCIHLKALHQVFKELFREQLWSLIRENPAYFHIERENGNENWNLPSNTDMIWIKTDLRLCEKHCRRGKHCSGECGELHLCRNYLLLGDMCCPFQKSGKSCAFGHNLQTHHNNLLLQKHNLIHFSENELRVLFRRRICRSVSTMPQICIYYNGKGGKGCSNKQCKSLHLCLDFVHERCHGPCLKNHSMSTEQVAFTLDLFAIDKSWPDDSVLEDLRSIMRKRIRQDSDVSSVASYSCDEDSDHEINGAEAKDLSGNHRNHKCCFHCKNLRSEMMKLKERINFLEDKLDRLREG